MQRIFEQFLGWACLDKLTQVHDADVVRNKANNGQIVRDEHIGQTKFVLEILEQIQNLGRNGNIQGGDRFITDDKLGI